MDAAAPFWPDAVMVTLNTNGTNHDVGFPTEETSMSATKLFLRVAALMIIATSPFTISGAATASSEASSAPRWRD